MKKIKVVIIWVVAALLLFVAFPSFMAYNLEKEIKRQEAVRDYNCKHYGHGINKHYGRTICAPEKIGE